MDTLRRTIIRIASRILAVIALLAASGCNNDSPSYPDIRLILGRWEVTSTDSPRYGYIYDFAPKSESTYSWGTLTVYPASAHEEYKSFSWYAYDPANDNGVIRMEITDLSAEDSDDAWANTTYYTVSKLTADELWLTDNTVGGNNYRLKFRRYNPS
ncbi:MAG: hypothetical protein NC043_08210 [Muribaculaceae bacterium]|nr:hypothetical protein [Muribaculaceae bacterium]